MEMQTFKYKENDQLSDLTIVEINGVVWFIAKEVCDLLEIKNAPDALTALDDDEKLISVIPISGQNRKISLVNESGLYSLIFKSRKPSAKAFKKWVTAEVLPSIRQKGSYQAAPVEFKGQFALRWAENQNRVAKDYFSVVGELYARLYRQFEMAGYIIPDHAFDGKEIRPDVSVGKLFAAFLRRERPDQAETYRLYMHRYPSGVEVEARQYPLDMIPTFYRYIDNVWIPEHAEEYFKARDTKALDYLPKLLKVS